MGEIETCPADMDGARNLFIAKFSVDNNLSEVSIWARLGEIIISIVEMGKSRSPTPGLRIPEP